MPKGPAFQTQETIIARFRAAHGDRYDYSRAEYKGAIIPVEIICSTHGSFFQTPVQHYGAKDGTPRGCKKCAMIISEKAKVEAFAARKGQPAVHRKTRSDFITEANAVHGDTYDYGKAVYNGFHEHLTITCKTHGDFRQAPSKHISMGRGCPRCGRQSSKISDEWLESINVPMREYRLPERRGRVVDGFDPVTRTVYQFHGDFFHGNPVKYHPNAVNPLTKRTFGESYQRTCRLDAEIKAFGYNLIIMWEDDYKRGGPKPSSN